MPPKRSAPSPGGKSAAKKLKLSSPGSQDHMTLPAELEGEIEFKPTCVTSEGLPWNLKIISWNVNGIRAVVKSKKVHYLKFEDADIVCLQETKCAEADFPEEAKFRGYHKYYNSADKKGYSSTAVFSKVKPLSVKYGISIPEHDNEGRVITAEYTSFYLVNVYVPNSGQKTVRLPYRRKWNTDFLNYCKELDSKKPVVVAGDLNVAHTEIDLANPKTNTKNSGFTPEEREDFTTWLNSGFVDSFRSFHPELTGAYTFWTYMSNARKRNIGWRIDYFLVSSRFISRVAGSEIREKVLGSDHCPIMLLLADPSSGVVVDKVADKVADEVADKVANKVVDKVAEKVAEKVADKVADKVVESADVDGSGSAEHADSPEDADKAESADKSEITDMDKASENTPDEVDIEDVKKVDSVPTEKVEQIETSAGEMKGEVDEIVGTDDKENVEKVERDSEVDKGMDSSVEHAVQESNGIGA